MTKTTAINKAIKASRHGVHHIVYHWTDYPGSPGPNDYHVVIEDDYYVDPSCAWIPEWAVIFSTNEGIY